jgi:putative endonuclease
MYYIYILTNKNNNVLYTGVTNNLLNRIKQHKDKIVKGFSSRYNVNKLVYFEEFDDAYSAISSEKQIKAGSRQKKLDMVNAMNPQWIDLYKLIISEEDLSEFCKRRDEYLIELISKKNVIEELRRDDSIP